MSELSPPFTIRGRHPAEGQMNYEEETYNSLLRDTPFPHSITHEQRNTTARELCTVGSMRNLDRQVNTLLSNPSMYTLDLRYKVAFDLFKLVQSNFHILAFGRWGDSDTLAIPPATFNWSHHRNWLLDVLFRARVCAENLRLALEDAEKIDEACTHEESSEEEDVGVHEGHQRQDDPRIGQATPGSCRALDPPEVADHSESLHRPSLKPESTVPDGATDQSDLLESWRRDSMDVRKGVEAEI